MNLKKVLPKIFLFLLVSIVLIIILFSLNDINAIGEVLSTVSWNWMWISLGVLVLYILINPLSLYILGKGKGEDKISLKDSLMIGSLEYFFNGVTPFSSGGQPFQVYAYNKIGVKPSRSTGILLMNFVTYQIAVVLLCLLSLVYYADFTKGSPAISTMIVIGMSMNIFILLLFSSLGLSKTMRKLILKLITVIFSWKIFKGKLTKFISAFEQYCSDAQRTFKSLLHQKARFFMAILFKILSLVIFYMIPFFILRALKVENIGIAELAKITAMTTFSIAMTCFIPTPGASGGIEFAFQSLFITLTGVTSAVAVSGMLLWRFITYYLLLLISFIIYLIFQKMHAHHNDMNDVEVSDNTVEAIAWNLPEEETEDKTSL